MFGKKRAIIALEKLVSLIPQIVAFLVILSVLVVACNLIYTPKSRSLVSTDLERVAVEIRKLDQENEEISVPIFGPNYNLGMYAKTDQPKSGCGKKACICAHKKDGAIIKCETFDNIVKSDEQGYYFIDSGIEIGESEDKSFKGDKTSVRIVMQGHSIILS